MSEAKKASADRAKGSVKEAIGKLTGNSEVETEGREQKAEAERPSTPAAAERTKSTRK